MRDFKNMKRQRGRNRSGGAGGGSGGGKPQQNANRAFESNGPDNLKIRGHAQHVFEKYQQLSRDAMSAGDRVLGENFLQHAEHYFRLIRTLQPNRPYTDIVSRESFAAGFDIDFEEEGGGEGGEEQQDQFADASEGQSGDERGGEYREQPRQDRWETRGGDGQNRQDQNRQDQNRPDQARQGGYANNRNNGGANNGGANNAPRDRNFNRNDRWENRGGDNPRFDNNRDTQNRDQGERAEAQGGEDRRPERQDRYEQNRPERDGYGRDSYGRREGAYGERAPQSRDNQGRDPLPVVEPQAAPLTAQAAPAAEPAPTAKRTRVLRSRDGDESHTPAFLQAASAPAPAAGEDAPVKKPRGRPRKAVASEEAEDA